MNCMQAGLPAPCRREKSPVAPGEAGFTLIEIMVVITILAMLAALVGPRLLGQTDKARVTDAQIQIRNIAQALDLYKLDNAVYPTTEQGLEALVSKPTIGVIPHNYKEGGYMGTIPKDPWGNGYIYLAPGASGPYDLLSWGADGTEGGTGYDADITAKNFS